MLGALSEASMTPSETISATIPRGTRCESPAEFEVMIEPDPPAPELEHGDALATIIIRIATGKGRRTHQIMAELLGLLQSDTTKIDTTFLPHNGLEVWVELSQAKLVQLSALQIDGVAEVLRKSTGST